MSGRFLLILSIAATFFLLIPLICSLIGVFSAHWWTGDFEILLRRGRNDDLLERIPSNYTMHWLFAVRYGLTKVCWWAQHAPLSTQPQVTLVINPLVPNLHYCSDYDSIPPLDGRFEDFQDVYVCVVVGIVFNVLAFYTAFLDLCCFWDSWKGGKYGKYVLFVVVFTIMVATLALLIGVSIAGSGLRVDASFVQKTVPYFGGMLDDEDGEVKLMLNQVVKRLGLVDDEFLGEVFGLGFSFTATCVGVMFLLLSLICYFCCFQRSQLRYGKEEQKRPVLV